MIRFVVSLCRSCGDSYVVNFESLQAVLFGDIAKKLKTYPQEFSLLITESML